eukprot:TRINITY_DN31603_c0_g1_i1.p1 TRINITY_DN31603_c0_g1~~TRINITY_DN31603_c0_g1_i1.p1  ORF type:complete len:230 (-),score=46.35 TRINITY_DN31603_c0_g1_i1:219-908(-)
MPSPTEFRKSFGITQGAEVAGFEVVESKVEHKRVKLFQKYKFPICLRFKATRGDADPDQLLPALKKQVAKERIAYSAYGSPYECQFGTPTAKSTAPEDGAPVVVVRSEGACVRRYDVPKLGKKPKDQGGRSSSATSDEDKQLTKEAESLGLRVTKSRFDTSACSVCNEQILPGELIAKLKAERTRGGWEHLRCALSDKGVGSKRRGPDAERAESAKRRRSERVAARSAD